MLLFTGHFVRDEDVEVTRTPIEKSGVKKCTQKAQKMFLS